MGLATEFAPATAGSEAESLDFVREVLRVESKALDLVRRRLDGTIARAAALILQSPGNVIVTGMGKAGLVGQKLAATFSSTGTRRFRSIPPTRFMATLAECARKMSFWHSLKAARPRKFCD